ncbi:hypothetical protein J23TS9_53190 [Paenibacillus sp. J23TS9]|nr:hypothetical protein J23TS9_53190 [Paenibacillus sp. J23TS9]
MWLISLSELEFFAAKYAKTLPVRGGLRIGLPFFKGNPIIYYDI